MTGEGGCSAVPGEDHVTVLPVHEALHGTGTFCCKFAADIVSDFSLPVASDHF